MFGLRKVNGNTHSFETTFQNWKEKGEDVALLMPEFSAKWLPIAEESGSWSGWVLLRELFPLISAELAGMALMPETERLIGEWLSLSSTPLNLKYPELKYNRLCVGKVFDGVLSPAQPLIRIWTGELNIWLDKVTVCQYENAPTLDKKSLYWPIHFVIGFSKTCYRTIVDIEVGDVLLISNNFAYAVIYNTKICDLIYPEELKMVDHFEYEEDFETDDFDIKKSEIEINDENDYQQINSFEDLPVKIEFVLGKKIMNLYEIDDLCAKRIISLLPEPELVSFFEKIQKGNSSEDNEEIIDDENISIFSLLPAYALSEIKSAFIIGFYIYLPFVVVDLVISSVLLTLGMMMMSPVTISTPIKLILFVAMDGWTMLSKGLILQYFDLSINP